MKKPILRWCWYQGYRRWGLFMPNREHPFLLFSPKLTDMNKVLTWINNFVDSGYPKVAVDFIYPGYDSRNP